jgi:hypothetical protein
MKRHKPSSSPSFSFFCFFFVIIFSIGATAWFQPWPPLMVEIFYILSILAEELDTREYSELHTGLPRLTDVNEHFNSNVSLQNVEMAQGILFSSALSWPARLVSAALPLHRYLYRPIYLLHIVQYLTNHSSCSKVTRTARWSLIHPLLTALIIPHHRLIKADRVSSPLPYLPPVTKIYLQSENKQFANEGLRDIVRLSMEPSIRVKV